MWFEVLGRCAQRPYGGLLILLLSLILFIPFISFAQQNGAKVYYFTIDETIAKPAQRKTELAVKEAQNQQADILFLHLNTFGGELEAAENIRTLLLDAPMPVFVFIDKNAASAGALISIACDSIYMAQGASIGAASVVNQTGEIMPDKYQSYMRSMMRATAMATGRDPDMAQAMVDPDIEVKGISEKGKVLTFTTTEAIKFGFCEGEANSKEEVMQLAGVENYCFIEQEPSIIEKIILFLINPVVSGILIMLIVGGLYFELQTPGVGFPLIAALVAAALYFAPHYLQGLAQHWEILLFFVGIGLLILEIFVIPGFGVAGISGIVLIIIALALSMTLNFGFDFSFTPPTTIIKKTAIVLGFASAGLSASIWLGMKLITANTRFGTMALKTELGKESGFISQDLTMNDLVGKTGRAVTFLRPAGKVEIDDEIYDAVSEFGVIEKDTEVKIVRFENEDLVKEIFTSQSSVVVLGGHLSAFELKTHIFAMLGFKAMSIGSKLFDERVDEIFAKLRRRNGVSYYDRNGGIKNVMKNLKKGINLGVLIDQDATNDGVFVNFLGEEAFTPSTPIKIVMHGKIPLAYAFLVRGKHEKYVFYIEKAEIIETTNETESCILNLEKFNERLGEFIKKYPEQWVWMHNRWKRKAKDFPAQLSISYYQGGKE
jgi:membrane-bound serine protease (ClpP class)